MLLMLTLTSCSVAAPRDAQRRSASSAMRSLLDSTSRQHFHHRVQLQTERLTACGSTTAMEHHDDADGKEGPLAWLPSTSGGAALAVRHSRPVGDTSIPCAATSARETAVRGGGVRWGHEARRATTTEHHDDANGEEAPLAWPPSMSGTAALAVRHSQPSGDTLHSLCSDVCTRDGGVRRRREVTAWGGGARRRDTRILCGCRRNA